MQELVVGAEDGIGAGDGVGVGLSMGKGTFRLAHVGNEQELVLCSWY